MEADGKYLQDAESLKNIYLTGSGGQIPLSQVATVSPTNTPLAVNHQASLRSQHGVVQSGIRCRSGRQPRAIDAALARIGVPTGITASFQGGAKIFQQSLSSQPLLILAAIITIYLVLGMLYEKALCIRSPSFHFCLLRRRRGAGADDVQDGIQPDCIDRRDPVDRHREENAIMAMIDVAIETERREGLDPREAIYRACPLRFRPDHDDLPSPRCSAPLPLALGR